MSGVAGGVKTSCFMPRYLLYHETVRGMEAQVRTRWSRDLTAARARDIVFGGMVRKREEGNE